MARASLVRRWQDAAARRAEHDLAPTLRRRFDRLPQRVHDRRALRAERRRRGRPDLADATRTIEAEIWITNGYFKR